MNITRKVILVSAALCFCWVKIYANVSIYPYAIDFDASSNKRVASIIVTNPTSEKKTYRVSVVDMKQNIDGSYEEIPSDQKPDDSAAPYIAFSPKQFTLDGKERQTVNISRKPLLNAPDGDYTSHLKLQEIDTPVPAESIASDHLSVELKLKYNLTIPIYIKKGKTEGNLIISSAKPEQKNDKSYINVRLQRTEGNKYFRGKITIMQNKKILSEVKNIRIYPSTAERDVSIPLNEKADLTGKKIRIIYTDDTGKEKGNISEADFIL